MRDEAKDEDLKVVPYDASDFFDFDDVDEEPSAEDPRDACARRLSALRVGEEVQVGTRAWRVWRTRGVEVLVTKAGTKGRKLYQFKVVGFTPCTVEVQEVNAGTGDVIPRLGPIARGVLR